MRIPRFYCPELSIENDVMVLPSAAHRHAVQVLRMKSGESLQVFDGRGSEYEAILENVAKRGSSIRLGERIENNTESLLNITLLQGVSRGDRMDYALQKAVELGVTRIIPVVTERCNVQLSNGRGDKRLGHWHGVMVSACEQSGRSILPELDDIMALDESIAMDYAYDTHKLALDPLAKIGFTQLKKQDDIVLLIGPEGGFSGEELQQVQDADFQVVKFGPRVLRTETATVAALAIVQAMWGDLG